jgi:protein phosphatase
MLHLAARTGTGRLRVVNQDTFGISVLGSDAFWGPPEQSLHVAGAVVFGVYDGHGSLPNGDCGSRIVAQSVHARIAALGDTGAGELFSSLVDIVRDAGRDLFERGITDPRYRGLGTTATLAAVDGQHLSVVHVGDTRAFLFRDRSLRQISRDDSLANDLRDTGSTGAVESQWENVITQALGINETVRPSRYEIELEVGDLVLLCSDGISPMLDEARIATILRLEQLADASCRALVDAAEEAGGYDNETVVVARVRADADR